MRLIVVPEKRKKKRSFFDLFNFEENFFDLDLGEEGSGYSISVTYDETGKPIVDVKTKGDIDKAKLREQIMKQYPNAEIRGLETEPLVRFVEESEEKNKKEQDKAEKKSRYKVKIE